MADGGRKQEELRAAEAVGEILPQLFLGEELSAATPLVSMGMKFLRPVLASALDEFAGVPLSEVPRRKMGDRATLYNMRMSSIANATAVTKELKNKVSDITARSFYRDVLGAKEGKELDNAVQTDPWFVKTVVGFSNFVGEGTQNIASALARRQNILSLTAGKDIATARRGLSDLTGGVVKDLFTRTFEKGDFGSLGFKEVTELGSKLIQQGGLDSVSANNSATRIKQFGETLKGYGKAVEALKTTFGGDLNDVLRQMGAVSGVNVLTMSSKNIQDTAKDLEKMSLLTGIRGGEGGEAFHNLVSTFYTQGVAQVGGTEAFARNAATHYAYNLSMGVPVYGVSQEKLERAYARMAATTAASGKNRVIAAAYDAFLLGQKDQKDTEANRRAFEKEVGGDFSYSNMESIHNKYRKGISFSAMISNRRLDESADSAYISKLTFASTTSRIANLTKGVPDDIAKILGRSKEDLQKAGVDLSRPDTIFTQLRDKGIRITNDQATKLDMYVTGLGLNAAMTLNTGTQEAFAIMASHSGAERLRSTVLEDTKGKGFNLPGTGFESLVAAALRAKGKGLTFAEAFGALAYSVDVTAMDATQYNRYNKQLKRTLAEQKKKLEEKTPKTDEPKPDEPKPDVPAPSGEDEPKPPKAPQQPSPKQAQAPQPGDKIVMLVENMEQTLRNIQEILRLFRR